MVRVKKFREVLDKTGRFDKRPFFQTEDLDITCEQIVTKFLHSTNGKVEFPISTEDLKRLVEENVSDLDCYADLSEFGSDVEGVTLFYPGSKPEVWISATLTEDGRRENRLRTTLTHEFGHVIFHSYLFDLRSLTSSFPQSATENQIVCKRDGILNATEVDWMEWQAGYVCGSILMPKTHINRFVQNFCEQHSLVGSIGLTSQEANKLIEDVALTFQVSKDAARIRLLKLSNLDTTP